MRPPLPPGRIARCAAVALVATLAAAAHAHPTKRSVPTDLVRLQGYRVPLAAAGQRTVTVIVDGRELPFQAVDLRRFSLADGAADAGLPTDQPFHLQASPETLQRFRRARPEQRVTILAQWRPGRRDLFVVALDLCPDR